MILETLLAETFGVPVSDPRVQGVIRELTRLDVLDQRAILRRQIQADPCREYKVVMARYHVSRGVVYNAWWEMRCGKMDGV